MMMMMMTSLQVSTASTPARNLLLVQRQLRLRNTFGTDFKVCKTKIKM
jgi:hypothetical protein